ncbi:hypothetical protein R6Z07F_012401 [Ovis aries]
MNCSPSGSSVHGILQARILEWVAVPFSRGSSRPMDRTWVSCIVRQIPYRLSHQGSPPPPSPPAMPSQNPLNGGRRVSVRGRKISQPFLALKVEEAMSHGILAGSRCWKRRHKFDHWFGKIPHAVEQLSLCITTIEPVL